MTIVFDFDGVLVDSNQLKIDSFIVAIPESEPELRNLMREMYDPGKTRTEMFDVVFERLNKKAEEIPSLVKEYSGRYEQTVQDGIARRGARKEARELLEHLVADGHVLYINSDTPEEPLKKSVQALGLRSFFKEILGRPASKEENLQKIMQIEGVGADQILYFGDGKSDLRASQHFGCRFIGLRNEFNHWTDQEVFTTIGNIEELAGLL